MAIPPPSDNEFAVALDDFRGGGWIVSVLGGAGMLARLLLDDEEHPYMFWVRRVIAGAIVGVICYFGIALSEAEITGLKKAFILSTAGAFSPELMEWALSKYKSQLGNGKNKKNRKRGRKA